MKLKDLKKEDINFIKKAPIATTHIDVSYLLYWDLSTKVPKVWQEDDQNWEYKNLNLEAQEGLRHIEDIRYFFNIK